MRMDELDFDLPPSRIATEPATPRDSAKLMVIDRATGRIEHVHVRDLAKAGRFFQPGDLLVFNRSKVIPARFAGIRAGTNGKVGGLYLHSPMNPDDPPVHQVMLESRGTLRPGERIILTDDSSLVLIEKAAAESSRGIGETAGEIEGGEREGGGGERVFANRCHNGPVLGGGWNVRLESSENMLTLLERIGHPPLPPYIRKERKVRHQTEDSPDDPERYNTVYAREPGSVAAPTAGLHFTPELLASLQQQGVGLAYVTLHVGLGTFAPVRCEVLEDHVMHREWFDVPAETIQTLIACRQRGGRVIPIGTTTVRALESFALASGGSLGGKAGSECRQGTLGGRGAVDDGCRNEPACFPKECLVAGTSTSPDFREGGGGTDLFIYPRTEHGNDDTFRLTDGLMTNFHLPRSTLLAMVASLPGVGVKKLLDWYETAIQREYRFYSYGDAMLVLPARAEPDRPDDSTPSRPPVAGLSAVEFPEPNHR